MVEAARCRNLRPEPLHIARDVVLDRPAVNADGIRKVRARNHVVTGQLVAAGDAAGLPDADLRRDVDDVGLGKTRYIALEKIEIRARLPAAFDLAPTQVVGVGAVERPAVRRLELRDVDPPFLRIALRPHDCALAGKPCALALGLRHQLWNGGPRLA